MLRNAFFFPFPNKSWIFTTETAISFGFTLHSNPARAKIDKVLNKKTMEIKSDLYTQIQVGLHAEVFQKTPFFFKINSPCLRNNI